MGLLELLRHQNLDPVCQLLMLQYLLLQRSLSMPLLRHQNLLDLLDFQNLKDPPKNHMHHRHRLLHNDKMYLLVQME
jgi:hypothetical protein